MKSKLHLSKIITIAKSRNLLQPEKQKRNPPNLDTYLPLDLDNQCNLQANFQFFARKSSIQIPVDTIFIFIRVHFLYTDNYYEICRYEYLIFLI